MIDDAARDAAELMLRCCECATDSVTTNTADRMVRVLFRRLHDSDFPNKQTKPVVMCRAAADVVFLAARALKRAMQLPQLCQHVLVPDGGAAPCCVLRVVDTAAAHCTSRVS